MKRDYRTVEKIEDVLNRYSEFIKASILRLNPQREGIDAHDIAQEVRIKLWKNLNSEKKIKYRSSYIKRVAYTTTIDILRKVRREKEILAEYGNSGKMNPSAAQKTHQTHQEDLKIIIGEAVGTLKEPRRKVVKLYLLGMDLDHIAQFLGWTKNKVRNLLYRGLDDLRVQLKEKGIEYEN